MNIVWGNDPQPPDVVEADREPDSVFRFAADLRELRHARGNPTLRSMATTTLISKSVISEAFVGRRLPTANTVRELARVLGADATEWLTRRADLATPAEQAPLPSSPTASPRRSRRAAFLVIVPAAFVAAISAVALCSSVASPPAPSAGQSVLRALPVVPAINGADPLQTSCVSDATLVRHSVVADGLLSVSLMYSPQCRAAWGLATLRTADPDTTVVSLRLYPTGDRFGGQARKALTEGASTRTRILTDTVISDGVCLEVSLARQGAEAIEYDPPLCADPVTTAEDVASIH